MCFSNGVMAVSQVDQDVESSYRKNLMIVAAIVSIYSIAGGRFDSELVIAGAKLTFTKPEYLEYSSIVVLIFLWWRHWLVSHALRNEFQAQTYENSITPRRVSALARGIYENESRLALDEARKNNPAGKNTELSYQGKVEHEKESLEYIGLFYAKYNLSYYLALREVSSEMNVTCVSHFYTFFLANLSYRIAWIKQIIFNTQFGDAILPALMMFIAIISYGVNVLTR